MDHNQLSRVLVRLASTPDADACHVIPKLLPPLLCQLDPEPAATRDKALELLSHISKRISGSQKTIELPVCEIIKACSKDAPQFRKRIALTYLKRSLSQMTKSSAEVLQQILDESIFNSTSTVTWSNTLLNCFTKANLANVHVSVESALKDRLLQEDMCRLLVEKFRDFLLLSPYVQHMESKLNDKGHITFEEVPRGLDARAVYDMLSSNDVSIPRDRPSLQEAHKNITVFCRKFLNGDARLAVFAAGYIEGNQVVKESDERCINDILDENTSIETLRLLSGMVTGTSSDNWEYRRKPVPESVAVTCFNIMRKSRATFSEEFSKDLMDAILASLTGSYSSLRLLESGIELLHSFIQLGAESSMNHWGSELLKVVCTLLLHGIDQDEAPAGGRQRVLRQRIREIAYSCVGTLAERYPHIIRNEEIQSPDGLWIGVPEGLFQLLSTEDSEAQLSVVEACSRVSYAFRDDINQSTRLSDLLLHYSLHGNVRTRQVALEWTVRIFPFSDVRARYICLLLLDDPHQEIRDNAFYGLNPFGKSGQILGIDSRSGLRFAWDLAMESEAFVANQSRDESSTMDVEDIYGDDDDNKEVPKDRGNMSETSKYASDVKDPSADSPLNVVAPLYPTFPSLVSYLCTKQQENVVDEGNLHSLCEDGLKPETLRRSNFSSLGTRGAVCALQFAMTTMIASSLSSMQSVNAYLTQMSVSEQQGLVGTASPMRMLGLMAEFLLRRPTKLPAKEICEAATDVLVVLARLAPGNFATQYGTNEGVSWFKQLNRLPYMQTRENAAILYGLACRKLPLEETMAAVKELIQKLPEAEIVSSLSTQRLNEVHGLLTLIGWVCSSIWTSNLDKSSSIELASVTAAAVPKLVSHLLSPLEDVNRGATNGLMVLGRYYSLSRALTSQQLDKFCDTLENLRQKSISSQSTNIMATCDTIRCIGALAVGEMRYGNFAAEDWRSTTTHFLILPIKCSKLYFHIVQMLLRFESMKHELIQVQVGKSLIEASTSQATGFESHHVALDQSVTTSSLVSEQYNVSLGWLLDQLLLMIFKAKIKTQRKSVLTWLLCLLFACGKSEPTSKRLELLQLVFLCSLCQQDETIRQMSMKGASYMYTLLQEHPYSLDEDRKRLITNLRTLISSEFLNSGNNMQYSLHAKLLNLFQSVYPNFVDQNSDYFVQECSSSAMTADRSLVELWHISNACDDANIFFHLLAVINDLHVLPPGLDTTQSEDLLQRKKSAAELTPYFDVIIPRFYCYQFEAHTRVREYSKRAWSFLVDDHSKMMEKYSDKILKRCSVIGESDDWSQRVAAIFALSGVLAHMSLRSFANNVDELWRMVLRAMDDVHEDVRNCANRVIKELGNVTLRFCGEPSHRESNVKRSRKEVNPEQQRAVETALTYLLTSPHAISSSVKSVREVCLDYTVRLVKIAGKSMWRSIPLLLENALQGAAQLEPAELSYLQTHAKAETGIHGNLPSSSHIESLRVSTAREGMMGTIVNACIEEIRLMPHETLKIKEHGTATSLLEQLLLIVKKATGSSNQLPTRGLACHFYTQLVDCVGSLLEPSASGLINSFTGSMDGAPLVLQKSLGSCIAYTAVYAKYSVLRKTVAELKGRLNEASSTERQGIAHTLSKLVTKAKHRDHELDAAIVSAIFVHKFDEDVLTKEAWIDAWEETGYSETTGLRTFLEEVVFECTDHLRGKYWVHRRMASRAIVSLAATLAGYGQNYDTSLMGNCSVLSANQLTIGSSNPGEIFWKFLENYGYSSANQDMSGVGEVLERGIPIAYDARKPLVTCSCVLSKYAQRLASVIMQVISGAYWTGKESTVNALSAIIAYCPEAFQESESNAMNCNFPTICFGGLYSCFLEEIRNFTGTFNEGIAYKTACVHAISIVHLSNPRGVVWSAVAEVIEPLLEEHLPRSGNDIPDETRKLVTSSIEVLCTSVTSYAKEGMHRHRLQQEVTNTVETVGKYLDTGNLSVRFRGMQSLVVLAMRIDISSALNESAQLTEAATKMFEFALIQFEHGASFPSVQQSSLTLLFVLLVRLASWCASRSKHPGTLLSVQYPEESKTELRKIVLEGRGISKESLSDILNSGKKSAHSGVLSFTEKLKAFLDWCGVLE